MGIPGFASSWFAGFVVVLCLVLHVAVLCNGGKTSSFVRSVEKTDMPLDLDVFRVPPGYNALQQVHITQGDHVGKAVIVSRVTKDEAAQMQWFIGVKIARRRNRQRANSILINSAITLQVTFTTALSEIWSSTPNTTIWLELDTLNEHSGL